MASSSTTYTATYGGRFNLVMTATEVQVDTANNRSLVQVQLYMTCNQSAGHVYNYNQTPGFYIIDGSQQNRSTSYDFNPGVGTNYFLANGDQFWIGHNSDGTRTIGLSYYHDAQDGPYVGTAGQVNWSMALTNIARYANITQFYLNGVTDQALTINWAADANCDYVSWWSNAYDGGGHHDIPVSGSGLFVINLSNLVSNKQYDVTVAVRRADSGLWTTSGTTYATTNGQNNFLGFI
ncbi:MAG: hypothetical protein QFB87_04525 [Patescibacteria group bacterium]|nr:hypothetical protein [Patescibacteria group bacterium]